MFANTIKPQSVSDPSWGPKVPQGPAPVPKGTRELNTVGVRDRRLRVLEEGLQGPEETELSALSHESGHLLELKMAEEASALKRPHFTEMKADIRSEKVMTV